jgi:hypothetical protein
MSKRDDEWEVVFESLQLRNKLSSSEWVTLRASEIKSLGYEPRLLAKIDHSKDLPSVFKELKLGILPLSIDSYAVGFFNTFFPIGGLDPDRKKLKLGEAVFQTLNSQDFSSESSMLNMVQAAGVIEKISGGPAHQTISGRRRTPRFDFEIEMKDKSVKLNVTGAQIEVDAGFESANEVLLLEAKNKEIVDFNIRQLYFPYRTIEPQVSKKLRNFMVSREAGNLLFREYEFTSLGSFSSIREIDSLEVELSANSIPSRSKDLHLTASKAIANPQIALATFPQANSISKVFETAKILVDNPRSIPELAFSFEFDPRQAKYYLDAALYLGLVLKPSRRGLDEKWRPSSLAIKLFEENSTSRDVELANLILGCTPFAIAFEACLSSSNVLDVETIAYLVKDEPEFDELSWSTTLRRSSTIRAWIDWVFSISIE